ncbi:hypothetical protein Ae717Ps2_6814c [Pseudonocardia sp. Ae717_Ps2]|nr:hypothetical protein Ae717Ps2_6814c [Pseudonocardia sp. Ae717_Ps2]
MRDTTVSPVRPDTSCTGGRDGCRSNSPCAPRATRVTVFDL